MVYEDLVWEDLLVLIVMSSNIAAYQGGWHQFPSVIAVYWYSSPAHQLNERSNVTAFHAYNMSHNLT